MISDSLYRRIFETSIDLILITDSKGTFIDVSPSSLALLGYERAEMVGRSAVDFIIEGDLEGTRRELRAARRGSNVRHFTCSYRHKHGQTVTLSWTGVWSEPDSCHFFIGRDMTERASIEARRRQSEHLELIGQLSGGLSHDFNNLLGIIIGNLDLLQLRLEHDEASLELVNEALDASLGGAELNKRLLAFARKQPLKPTRISVNSLIAGVVKLLSRTLGEEIKIRFDSDAEVWSVVVDGPQLEAALTNLAVNARDAMATGGQLTIATRNTHLDDDYAAEHSEVQAGDYVLLEVSDTGHGMAPDVLQRVFVPFFTTKSPGKGTGLGLSMVFGFVKQSGGHLKIYSEVGAGTTVRIYLPRAAGTDHSAKEAAATAASPRALAREVVLAVEDNERLRRLVVKQLTDLGYCVLEAEDGRRAVEILRKEHRIDLLLTDIMMPGGLDGSDLAQIAIQLRPALKVMFTSAFPHTALGDRGVLDHGQHFLAKPYRKQQLAEMVRAVLDA